MNLSDTGNIIPELGIVCRHLACTAQRSIIPVHVGVDQHGTITLEVDGSPTYIDGQESLAISGFFINQTMSKKHRYHIAVHCSLCGRASACLEFEQFDTKSWYMPTYIVMLANTIDSE